jgi:TrmH family RNA methyltransferase
LGRRSARVEEGAFVVEGASLVAQAVAAEWELEAVFVAHGHWSYQAPDAPVFELAPNVMERVASTESPQPVLAVVRRRTTALADIAGYSFVLVGDQIGDPGNAGTMLRSAEAAGAEAVVFTSGSVDVFNPKVVRASAGALFAVPVVVDVDLPSVLGLAGFRSFGTSSHSGRTYAQASFADRSLIIVGNEAHGLADTAAVTEWITIPHVGRAESLNVAMAATVLVFEVARQRADR